ncbi:PucR family transcriptional regulator ligand-binding domain-containing protein [Micromonospora soli]|uniref:PucR family transcriptional regulator n=1 Tax=Micromonospora sp. NBRC 110009 TaxID=3061627 RepID=UPI002672AA91|nr:PucR family transcriptional regulator [Micromonospora sp. NBRC 110009]WKT98529.1 PucR family transcriptional regulator ligand-binding domain-containing protein [Micromonospora sp. NBRC 110009]
MLLREVLALPQLRLSVLAGADDLDRPLTRIYVTDLLDPRRYLSGGEVVLTGLMWRRSPTDSETFVAACAAAGVAAIGAGDAAYGSVPADLVEACRAHRVPLFEVPVEVSFRDILDEVNPSLWARRATGLATVLVRHRGLVAAMAAGARLGDLLSPVAADLGVDCWVLTPTGRVVAGTTGLDATGRADVAAAFVAADRLPMSVAVDGRPLTVLAVPGRSEHRLASWLLAVTAGAPAPLPDAADELVSLVALARAQADEATLVERRLADRVGSLLDSGGDLGELRGRLSSCGLSPDSTFLVLTASLTGLPAPAELAVAVVEEILRPYAPQTVVAGLAADRPGGVLAVVSVPAQPMSTVLDTVRAGLTALVPALGAGRLAVGISGPAAGVVALPGAVEEARHAWRAASDRPGPATVVSAGELASHLLLLAGVPTDTRRAFRDRLLGPLVEYDRVHDARLVHTLEAFLACSGSWTRCAELLHVHVNTLRYRIGRVEQLTGRDLNRFEDRVDLFLALRLPG